jgi:predicted nucleotidyltransferase
MNEVGTYLTSLADQLIIEDGLRQRIDKSIGYLRGKIWELFQDKLASVSVFGSYDRNTIIPLDDDLDVDILIIFKTNELQPDTYLKKIKEFCEKNYPKSEIYQDHPTVAVELDHIKFELVPSFYNSNGVVKIPASRSEKLTWITTNPEVFKNKVLTKDKNNKNLIIPLIRVFKYWNILNGKPFKTFELENYIVSKEYFSSTVREYFYAISVGLDTIAKSDNQKECVDNLKERIRRLKGLEQIKVFNYIDVEFSTFLPKLK